MDQEFHCERNSNTWPSQVSQFYGFEVADRLALKVAIIRRMILERRIAIVRPSVRAVRVLESEVRRIIEAGYTVRMDFAGGDGRYHNYHNRTI